MRPCKASSAAPRCGAVRWAWCVPASGAHGRTEERDGLVVEKRVNGLARSLRIEPERGRERR